MVALHPCLNFNDQFLVNQQHPQCLQGQVFTDMRNFTRRRATPVRTSVRTPVRTPTGVVLNASVGGVVDRVQQHLHPVQQHHVVRALPPQTIHGQGTDRLPSHDPVPAFAGHRHQQRQHDLRDVHVGKLRVRHGGTLLADHAQHEHCSSLHRDIGTGGGGGGVCVGCVWG